MPNCARYRSCSACSTATASSAQEANACSIAPSGPRTAGHRQDARILPEIQRILHDVAVETLAAQRAVGEFAIERQRMDRRAQAAQRVAMPYRKSCHGACSSRPQRMEMVHRPVPAAHRQPIARGQRGGQIRLGAPRRLDHLIPRQQCGDRRRQRAAGAVRVARVDAAGRQFDRRRCPSNSRSGLSAPSSAPPFSSTACAPSRCSARTVRCISASVAGAVRRTARPPPAGSA